MAPNLILLAGAPAAATLRPESYTLTAFDDVFSRFLGLAHHPPERVSPSHAVWRSLPLARHTGFSQVHDLADASLANRPDFFTTADASFSGLTTGSLGVEAEDDEDVLSQFCEHSLAAHTSFPSSQLDSFDESSLLETSFAPTFSAAIALPSHLSDLEDIPPARHITALNPQTVTLNLIVGIISIAQPRAVTTRWGHTLSLVEVLVGDETRSGFAVTFWLVRDGDDESRVRALRRQDVVLLQNVALHVFRGKVYGQSLRRGLTRVDVLWRRDGTGAYSARHLASGTNPQLKKTRLVKDWVIKFVGSDPAAPTRKGQKSWDKPPDDTQ
ncbi:hypothetical protein G7046_g7393 [Stylonectria norvegica]|nr:hypothetical protein G7046_g7393 [Stylonectria norvegica]